MAGQSFPLLVGRWVKLKLYTPVGGCYINSLVNNYRILILTHNYPRFKEDYAGLFLHNLFKEIAKMGHKVWVVAPHEKKFLSHQVIDGVEIYRFKYTFSSLERLAYRGNMQEVVFKNILNFFLFFSFLYKFFLHSYKLAKNKNVDIISSQWWVPGGVIGFLVSAFTHKPLMITMHGTDIRIIGRSKILRSLAKPVFQRAKLITVVSSFLRNKLLEYNLVDERKVKILPMPVDTTKFKPSPLTPKDKKKILSVARFTEQKGVNFLIDALNILKQKNIDFEAQIIGGGPLRIKLENKIREVKLEDRIFLLDSMPQEKLYEYYIKSDLCVLPSMDEGFGLVLVEAQLCQRPVIGTNSGGIPDIIEDGKTGLLFKPKDSLDLARAMEKVSSDFELAKKLAEGGYKSALEKFSPETIREKYLDYIESACDETFTPSAEFSKLSA